MRHLFGRLRATMVPFNRLTTTAFELQELFSRGKLSSRDAVTAYLEQVEIHNTWLKAVIATTPKDHLQQRAKLLDDERQQGKVRGPLHGIPILIKVRQEDLHTIFTHALTIPGLYRYT
jgi:amidase